MNASDLVIDGSAADLFRSLPGWEQFNGIWLLHETYAQNLATQVRQMNLHVHVSEQRDRQQQLESRRREAPRYGTEQNIAVIAMHGTMTKRGSSMTAGVMDYRRALRESVKDPDVAAVLLHIDSPGGSVFGLEDLSQDIQTARQSKPVWAYAEDLCASAAYYVGCQADKFYANKTAIVGSIGTFFVVPDFSKFYEREGIVFHKFVAGEPFKAAGVMATELTADQQAELQREVESVNAHFLQAIQRGRGFSPARAKELNTGAVWIGQAAADQGLIDGIDSLDNVLAALSQSLTSDRKARRSQSAELPSGATGGDRKMQIETLKAALPGASKEFLFDCMEAGHTVEQATQNWVAELEKRHTAQAEQIGQLKASNDQLTAKMSELEAQINTLKAEGAGDAISEANTETTAPAGGTFRAQWNALVASCTKECGGDRSRGASLAAKRQPELREQMLEEANRPTK